MSRDPVEGSTDAERLEHLKSADEAINNCAGKKFSVRVSSFRRILRSWHGFAIQFLALLDYCESDEEASSELARNVGDLSVQDQLILALDQSILAYTSGLCAVVEQRRIIEQRYLSDVHMHESMRRNEEIKNNHPYGLFFAKLRNHLLHSLSAPWTFAAFLDSGTGSVGLATEPLLNKARLDSSTKKLLREAGDKVVIHAHIRPHLEAMVDHYKWLVDTAVADQVDIIQEHDQLVERRNLILTCGRDDGRDKDAKIADIERQLAENRAREDKGEAR